MVISSHARRYLVAAIYISLSTVRSFAYNEPRAFTPFHSLLNRFANVEARSRSHRPNTGVQSFDRKNIGRFLCWKFRRIVLLKVTIPLVSMRIRRRTRMTLWKTEVEETRTTGQGRSFFSCFSSGGRKREQRPKRQKRR